MRRVVLSNMKKAWLLIDITVDNRFTLPEVKFQIQRALEAFINNLEDEDEDGIQLGEVTLIDADPTELLGGHS
jgi:hypothetical protein